MPPVKGKGRKSSKGKGRGRRKQASPAERMVTSLRTLGANILTVLATGLAVIAAVVVLMLYAGGYFSNIGERIDLLTGKAARMIGFTVTRVTVKGAAHVSDRAIMQALNDPTEGSVLGRSLLHVDIHAARATVEEIGWIEAAAVQRLWPNTIHVSVIERTARALWQDAQGQYSLVDEGGRILAPTSPTAYVALPVVAGTNDPAIATEILSALGTRPALAGRVAVVMSVGERRFDLRFRNDFTARLPEDNLDKALERLEGLGAGTGKLAATLDYIDLRDPEWAYVKPKTSS